MATSSTVVAGDLATAIQYNDLRTDVLSTHIHDGTDGNAALGGAVGVGLTQVRVQDNGLLIDNPAGTFAYTLLGAAIVANRNLSLPLIIGADTLAVLGLAQTFSALQTFSAGIDLNNASAGIVNVGAAGNIWTANSLAVSNSNSGGDVSSSVFNTSNTANSRAFYQIVSGGSSAGDPFLSIKENGGHELRLGVDVSTSIFALNVGGAALGINDVLRFTDATPPVITYNTTHPVGTFDYVCGRCGRHKAEPFVCCGKVDWHDDVPLALAAINGEEWAIDQMALIGVMQRTIDDNGKPEVFTTLGMDVAFAWSMAGQNRQRFDEKYEELNRRLTAIGG